MYKVMQEAVRRGRAGEGPTLIEAETYRYYAHTSDDNDTCTGAGKKSRPGASVTRWRGSAST